MFGMGMPELMLIMAVALVVIGPKKLPGLAKSIGRAMSEFKSATRDFKRSIDLDSDLQDVKGSMNNLKDIPSYEPDPSVYKKADTDRTTDNAADATETTDARADTADNAKSPPDPEADEPSSPGAKSHG